MAKTVLRYLVTCISIQNQ